MGKPSPSPSNSRRDDRRRLFRRLLTVGLLLIAVALGDNFVRRATAVNPVTDPEPGGTSGAGGGAGSWREAKQDWSAGPGSHDSRDAHESTGERRRDDERGGGDGAPDGHHGAGRIARGTFQDGGAV